MLSRTPCALYGLILLSACGTKSTDGGRIAGVPPPNAAVITDTLKLESEGDWTRRPLLTPIGGGERVWVHGDFLYWEQNADEIHRAPLSRIEASTKPYLSRAENVLEFAGDEVFWQQANQIKAMPIAGGTARVVTDSVGYAYDLVRAGDHLVWLTSTQSWQVRVAPIVGGPSKLLFESEQLNPPLAVSGDDAYFRQYSSPKSTTHYALISAPIAGGEAHEIHVTDDAGGIGVFTVDSGMLYFSDSRGIVRAPLTNPEQSQDVLVPAVRSVDFLAVAGDTLVYQSYHELKCIALTGDSPAVVLGYASTPEHIAVDTNYVYWAAGNKLFRASNECQSSTAK